jgi:hypothetical protein
MKYSRQELLRLDKEFLIDIILQLDTVLNRSQKGQAKRNNLVGESFGALKVIADAGNELGHSTWHCRCSGNIYNAEATTVCDHIIKAWGSNLKAGRQRYCGDESCPAARQVLGERRREGRQLNDEFLTFLHQEQVNKFALMGASAAGLTAEYMEVLKTIFSMYYGVNETNAAFKVQEIAQALKVDEKVIAQERKVIEQYIEKYQGKR